MPVTVFTVTMLVLRVIMIVLVMSRIVAVVFVLEAEGQSSLVPGCHVEPVLLLQLPPRLVPFRFQLSQSPSDELLLWGAGEDVDKEGLMWVILNLCEPLLYIYISCASGIQANWKKKNHLSCSPAPSGSQSLLG